MSAPNATQIITAIAQSEIARDTRDTTTIATAAAAVLTAQGFSPVDAAAVEQQVRLLLPVRSSGNGLG